MIVYDECHTNIGLIRFTFNEIGQLTQIILTEKHWKIILSEHMAKQNQKWGEIVRRQCNEYVRGERLSFNIPFKCQGTPFQKQVWYALLDIPYGHVKTYSDIAASIGKPRAARAVGRAIANNPLPLIIPCHRVIGKNNKQTGYIGGLKMKGQLLELETKI